MRHHLSLAIVGTLLAGGGITNPALAQEKYKPKYQRENDTTFRANASYLSETGFIKFRPDKDIDPDTYFDKFGTSRAAKMQKEGRTGESTIGDLFGQAVPIGGQNAATDVELVDKARKLTKTPKMP